MARPNPIRQIVEKQQPLPLFHTHVIDRQVLDAAVAARKSLEVDLCMDEAGGIYVGHPLSHYQSAKLPPPNNLPLNVILSEMKAADLFLILDCKDVRVLPKAQEIIKEYGPENSLFHSWSDGLILNPYLEEWDTIQPNWPGEELPHDKILELRRATKVPMTLSCHRGLTQKRLETDGDAIADRIIEAILGDAEGVSFCLPENQFVPIPVMKRLLDHDILTTLHTGNVPPEARPPVYLGWTDDLQSASDPKDFQ